jgi:hypothetical protein
MNSFNIVSLIIEQARAKKVVQLDPEQDQAKLRLDELKKKAEKIRTHAELLRAKNQLRRAKIEREKINSEQENPDGKEEKKVAVFPKSKQDTDLNSGNPINTKKVKEDIVIKPDGISPLNEAEGDEPDPKAEEQETPQGDKEEAPEVSVAGEEPQTKEEAEIARVQAQTREIQARMGEYSAPGGTPEETGADAGMPTGGGAVPGGENIGAMPGDMGAAQDPSLMGQPQEKDPMQGFGDTTNPANASAMGGMGLMGGMGGMGGGIDPLTGMPTPDGGGGEKSPTALGRLYILKKIYYRLALIDRLLKTHSDPELIETAKVAAEAFEIFKLIVHNLKSYKDKIDDIIIDYYLLLKDLCTELESKMKKWKLEQGT